MNFENNEKNLTFVKNLQNEEQGTRKEKKDKKEKKEKKEKEEKKEKKEKKEKEEKEKNAQKVVSKKDRTYEADTLNKKIRVTRWTYISDENIFRQNRVQYSLAGKVEIFCMYLFFL